MVTLEEAREAWDITINGKGGDCPCCDRFGRIYERPFNAMAKSLIWLTNVNTNDPFKWVHVPSMAPKSIVRTNQLATTRWWGLIVRMANNNPKIKHSGMWRTTRKGRRFARGLIHIPLTVYTYNGEAIDYSEEQITVEDAFDTSFDYEQVMGEYGPEGP